MEEKRTEEWGAPAADVNEPVEAPVTEAESAAPVPTESVAEHGDADATAPQEAEAPEEGAAETSLEEGAVEQAEEPAADPAPTVDWSFGGAVNESPKRGGGQKQFFIMFGVIFGICLALLCLTLLIGDGFQIVRNITKDHYVYVREDDGTSGLLTPQEAADKVKRSTVTVSVTSATGSGIGSGFVYSADGYICTNYHVIESGGTIQVILPDGKAVDAVVKGYNKEADVAVLKIEAEGLVPAEIGSSDDLLVGERVVAVGTPAKLDYAGTSTFGTVSALNRLVQITDSATGSVSKKMRLIQTDTSVNPGNSGGPLANMYGKVVGVVVMKVSSYGGSDFEGIAFALPMDGVRVIVDEIIAKGSFTGKNPIAEKRSLLGVTGHGGVAGLWYRTDPMTGMVESSEAEQAGFYQMPVNGIYVMEVSGNNAKGKVTAGDVITQVNGLNVANTQDLIGAVNRYLAGETVTLTLYRNGETVHVDVVLMEEASS